MPSALAGLKRLGLELHVPEPCAAHRFTTVRILKHRRKALTFTCFNRHGIEVVAAWPTCRKSWRHR